MFNNYGLNVNYIYLNNNGPTIDLWGTLHVWDASEDHTLSIYNPLFIQKRIAQTRSRHPDGDM